MSKAFYYDVVCPYAYMAFSFLKKSEAFKRHDIALKPILLGGLFAHLKREQNPNSTMAPAKASYMRKDIERQADFFSVGLRFHPRHPVSTVNAMRLVHAAKPPAREALSARLYQAYWQENLDIDNEDVLRSLAEEYGVDPRLTAGEQAKHDLIAYTEEAFHQQVFGVPTLAINHRLYFGGDRLFLLKDMLQLDWPDTEWCTGRAPIDFYFDFSSPYSYLAWSEVRAAKDSGVAFRLKPVLLGAIFKEIGVANIPMLNAHPYKTAYITQDMQDWADLRKVDFHFSSHFPLRTVLPLRVALIDNHAIDPIFHAAWAKDLDVGRPETLAGILREAGLPAEQFIQQSEDDNIKNQLKANTSEAINRGAFGVPTFFVNQCQVFGQDRFSWIRQELMRVREEAY